MINFGTTLEQIQKATKEELIDALCTSDGCGVEKKKFILNLLLNKQNVGNGLIDADEYFGKQLKVYP